MHLFGSATEECADIVAKLGAAHDGIVTEHHPFAVEYRAVGNEFHLGHKVASRLVARGEGSVER